MATVCACHYGNSNNTVKYECSDPGNIVWVTSTINDRVGSLENHLERTI